MSRRRELGMWAAVALVALAALLWVVRSRSTTIQRQSATQVATHLARGEELFRQKGCETCHGDGGSGGRQGPPLRQSPTLATLPRLVAAMWNHAPRMWESMQSQNIAYPVLDYEESGQLVAFLYLAGHADQPGNAQRGRELFVQKQCARCHSDSRLAPDLARTTLPNTPVSWTQVLWNHGSEMQARMAKAGVAWPKFQANDLRDLYAYVRQANGNAGPERVVEGDPARGWNVFQQKGCLACHGLTRDSGSLAPAFGHDRQLPPTFAQFGEAMLNHFPEMQRAMNTRANAMPVFADSEMADLAVFLYSLHFLEPSGSPHVGASLFAWRGCAQCHGEHAEGTGNGPPLRGVGKTYTAVRLSADLWRHGSKMYALARAAGRPWPILSEDDVGDLLAFLNTSPQ